LMMIEVPTAVIDAISEGERFVILGHRDPDGDSLGSMLAISAFLREQFRKESFMPGPLDWPEKFFFLEKHLNGAGKPFDGNIDTLLILDCSAENRIDWANVEPNSFPEARRIVIDHHREGEPFGDVNWIDPRASATGEMIFNILEALGAQFTSDIAESIYSAILTDTGRFTYSNTTAKSLEICAKLVQAGNLDLADITSQVYYNFSEEYLRNIGIALYNTRVYRDSKILLLTLDKASVKSFSTTFDDTEGIIDFAMSVRGVEVAALFKEISRNVIRVSLRSRGKFDVGAIAVEMGGGGHHNAAGCTMEMPLSLARDVILRRFEDLFAGSSSLGERH